MGRNIIICSDGTGNTFDHRSTNITRMITYLELTSHKSQVVVYDQGVGANSNRVKAVTDYLKSRIEQDTATDEQALRVPVGRSDSAFPPKAVLQRLGGQCFGYGLKRNVMELYQELATLYEGPEDRVFLFGFSRGAFTVRALAGLLYQCGLPPASCTDFVSRFEEAWRLYKPLEADAKSAERFRETQRLCEIHFLGIWDTVKSYGGLNPIALPHLRHNPIVAHVRHALALHERRAWFKPTTWGQLDQDKGEEGAMARVEPDERYSRQTIDEVWFAGCHSDIGGGAEEYATAMIALRWMLGEAVNVPGSLRLNDRGKIALAKRDPPGLPWIHPSRGPLWRATEYLPRREIYNLKRTVKRWRLGPNGRRNVLEYLRNNQVRVHISAEGCHSIPEDHTDICQTRDSSRPDPDKPQCQPPNDRPQSS